MSLLALEHVCKAYRRGRRTFVALDDVSFAVGPGEYVAVWGGRRSGRTTLARVAAGFEPPDSGAVRFTGDDARQRGFVKGTPLAARQEIDDYVALPLLACGTPSREARERACEQLSRLGVGSCAGLRAGELTPAELVRVGLAQVLVARPRLVILDEPTREVDLLEREPLLTLLRRIADDGTAILTTTGDAIGVAGVDRALTISDGRLRADVTAEPAPVIPLVGLTESRERGSNP